MIFRWLNADTIPEAVVRVVPVDALDDALPAETRRVDPATRHAIIERRRQAIRRRFPR